MLDKLLREIIVITVGKPAEPIADLLNSKKHVNEFNIAKKMEITINQTRNILYKISDHGLVSSERKKDKKKGWYTYFWRFEIAKCLDFLKNKLLDGKAEYEKEIGKRKGQIYYACDLCGVEQGESEALLMDFTCDECGELFEAVDNSKLIKELEKNLTKINEKLELVEVEIGKENKKLDHKKLLEFRKEEKEKLLKKEEAKKRRDEKRKEKLAEKAKADKKSGKKVAKKKVVKKKVAKKKIVKKKVSKKKVTKKKPAVNKKIIKKKIAKKKIVKKVVKKTTKKVVPSKRKSLAASFLKVGRKKK